MGIQDRDYYWEHRAKLDADQNEFFRPRGECLSSLPKKLSSHWHPVLSVFLFVVICLGVYGVLRLISKFI